MLATKLLAALEQVKATVLKPSTKTRSLLKDHPELLCVHLEANGERLTITATDLKKFSQADASNDRYWHQEIGSFACLVPFELFYRLIQAMKQLDIGLDFIAEKLVITASSPKLEYNINCLPLEHSIFKSIDSGQKTIDYEFPFAPVLKALQIVSKGCYKEDGCQNLQGIHLKIKDSLLTIEASDGDHIIRYWQQLEDAPNCDEVIDRGIVAQLAKAKADTLRLELSAAMATFIAGDCRVTTVIGDLEYPNTDKAIAKAIPDSEPIAVDRRLLKDAIDRVATKAEPIILIEADPVDCCLRLSGCNGEETIPVNVSQWAATHIDRTMLDVLGKLGSSEVMLCLGRTTEGDPRMTTIETLGGDRFFVGAMGVKCSDRTLPIPKIAPTTATTGDSGEVAIEPLETPTESPTTATTGDSREVAIEPLETPTESPTTGDSQAIGQPDHPEVGTLEPDSSEAFDRLREQLKGTVKTPMPDYVISVEEMKQTVVISLRPDSAAEIVGGMMQVILQEDLDMSKPLQGRFCLIHCAYVEGDELKESDRGLIDIGLLPDSAPSGSILGYVKIKETKVYKSETDWRSDFEKGVHDYDCSLKEFRQDHGVKGKVCGVVVEQPIMLRDPVFGVEGGVSAGFWLPNSPQDTSAVRAVFEATRGVVDVDRLIPVDSE